MDYYVREAFTIFLVIAGIGFALCYLIYLVRCLVLFFREIKEMRQK